MRWRLLNTGARSGEFNMRLDEELAMALLEGEPVGTLRVFAWKPFAVSLGWNQSQQDIDRDAALSDGIDVVRRPTGGRAILHARELTYSVTMLSERSGVLQAYSEISRALVEGLRLLGVDAAMEKSQPHFPSLYREAESVACFTSSARHEIKVRGRKIVGSAQRRYARRDGQEVVLQHGSVLTGPEHRSIVKYLALKDERQRQRVMSELEEHTTDLAAELGRTVTFEEAAQAVRRGFEIAWGIRFSEVVASTDETAASVAGTAESARPGRSASEALHAS
jgi:lipoate-protein ligase A